MYKYYNANPKNEIIGDCVVRAISTALDIDYYDVLNMLYNISNYFNCDMLVKDCYKELFDRFKLTQYTPNVEKRVKDVIEDFKDKILIIRIDGHLTASKYGILKDTWDCSDEIVDTFWVLNENR